MTIDSTSMKTFVLSNPNLVSMKPTGNGLFVLKYKKKVFFNDLWNDYLEECRGTIVDADFNVVSRPFTKVYNYGVETRAPKLPDSTLVTAYRKVNGFMVALTWYKDDVLVSTTGSTDSEFVGMAKEMMLKHAPWTDWQMIVAAAKGSTLMFECVHPNDPHIVVETPGMYFLGYRSNSWDSVVEGFGVNRANAWSNFGDAAMCYSTESYVLPLGELKEKVRKVQHEGFVFYTADNVSSKIKSPFYLTSKWVARNPRVDKLIDLKNDIKQRLDEEYYPLIDAIRANIDEYSVLDEQSRLAWVRNFLSA